MTPETKQIADSLREKLDPLDHEHIADDVRTLTVYVTCPEDKPAQLQFSFAVQGQFELKAAIEITAQTGPELRSMAGYLERVAEIINAQFVDQLRGNGNV